jgi:hypothetical protein
MNISIFCVHGESVLEDITEATIFMSDLAFIAERTTG